MDNPIRPGLNLNLKPLSSQPSRLSSAPGLQSSPVNNRLVRQSVFNKLDVTKIGQGRLLTEGSYDRAIGLKRDIGLKGQLMAIRRSGRRNITKNLSLENVKQIHDLIANPIKNKAVGSSSYISRQDRLKIMQESRKLVKTEGSHFTRSDRKDLLKIVDTLRQQYKDNLFKRGDL